MCVLKRGAIMKIEEYKNIDETILWKGKPNKKVFIKERIFSPFLIFALVWLAIDFGIIFGIFAKEGIINQMPFIIPFFIVHLLPVWIYFFAVFSAFFSWKNIEYMVTDKAVYVTQGIFSFSCVRKSFQEVTNVSVHQGMIDKRHDVGDVFVVTGYSYKNGKQVSAGINILDIEDYMKVYKLINKTGMDIYSDTMYPNDLRPKENNGYETKYNPDKKDY